MKTLKETLKVEYEEFYHEANKHANLKAIEGNCWTSVGSPRIDQPALSMDLHTWADGKIRDLRLEGVETLDDEQREAYEFLESI